MDEYTNNFLIQFSNNKIADIRFGDLTHKNVYNRAGKTLNSSLPFGQVTCNIILLDLRKSCFALFLLS